MSDTTPTPQPHTVATSPDPADATDTAQVQPVEPAYAPVAAADHVAPEADVPAVSADAPADVPSDETGDGAPGEPDQSGDEVEVEPEPASDAAAVDAEPATVVVPAVSVEPATVVVPAEPDSDVDAAEPVTAVERAEPVAAVEPIPAPTPASPTPTPSPAYAGQPQPYNAPVPPKKKSNRGLGILIAVIGVVVFAAVDAAAAYGILALHYGESDAQGYLTDYLQGWEFWIPLAVFAGAFIALVAIVNRGRWWGYILGSIFVAALVFVAYLGAALVTNRVWERTPAEFRVFIRDYFEAKVPIPYLWIAIAATFIALEVVTWLGGWIAFHGGNVKRRNAEAKAAFEAEYGPASVR